MNASDLLRTLRSRAQWYRDGCDGLEDLAAYQKDGLAHDAASDLTTALDLYETAEAEVNALRKIESRETPPSPEVGKLIERFRTGAVLKREVAAGILAGGAVWHGASAFLDDALDLERAADALAGSEADAQALRRARDAWEETAAFHCRNEFFYRDLVTQIGEPFGVEAKTSDDGSVQDSVLALKVPELVERQRAQLAEVRAESEQRKEALIYIANMGDCYQMAAVAKKAAAVGARKDHSQESQTS